MIQIAEKGKIPVYELECKECHSKLRYTYKDLIVGYITCPLCGYKSVEYYSDAKKVDEISTPDYICEDVKDVLIDLDNQLTELEKSRYELPLNTNLYFSNDSYIMGIKDCRNILEKVKKNWQV